VEWRVLELVDRVDDEWRDRLVRGEHIKYTRMMICNVKLQDILPMKNQVKYLVTSVNHDDSVALAPSGLAIQ